MEDSNRRKHVRIDHANRITFRMGESQDGDLIDISNGGVSFTSTTPLPLGSLVDVILLNNNVSVAGNVRYLEKINETHYRIGVEFESEEGDVIEVMLKTDNSQV